jgi:ferrochelatase
MIRGLFVVFLPHRGNKKNMPENLESGRLRGVCVANLGTPESPDRKPVARFLREFLSDPRVIDLPRYLWLPLLNLVIIPFRSGRSAAAYRKIWLPEGSPLLVFTQRLASRLAIMLDGVAKVETGMRYGEPSIRDSLKRLKESGVDEVVILPLYPQYSDTTTASIYDSVDESLKQLNWQPALHRVEQYYDHPLWVEAVASSIREYRELNGAAEKLIFSLHGIPERYVAQGDPYQDQCRKSVQAIVAALGLGDDEWLLTYQSRVGREPWLQPYTDETLRELGSSGTRRVQVVCPGFAVDCLETLEEIAMQNGEFFEQAGGEKLEYIPALNDSDAHVRVMQALVMESISDSR